MLSTWDRYRVEAGRWQRAADRAQGHQHQDPVSAFMVSVDRLLYFAAAALVICVVSIAVT